MLLISERQKERLYELLPDTANSLLSAGDLDAITLELMFLTMELNNADDEPTDESRAVERFMDDLIWQNLHPEDFPVYDGKSEK